MTRDEAIEAVTAAITAGIINDEGSGSNVDICIITKDGVHFQRSYKKIGDTSAGRFDLFQWICYVLIKKCNWALI